MRVTLLAKRYAQALFDLAVEYKILEEVANDMKLVGSTLEKERVLKRVMANPVLDAYKKNRILDKLFGKRVNKLTLRFLLLITRKGREEYIIFICQAFDEIYKESKNIMPVVLTTAYHAEKKIKDQILKKLAGVTKKQLEVEEVVDESLIGGFKLDFEDYQYDNSIKRQLKRLHTIFEENPYIIKY